MADRYFIDPHCHFFNIDDIPIIPTATAQLPVNSILVLGLFFKKATLKALDRFKPFIQFFENNRQSNLESHVSGIWETIDPAQFQGVILTPLIMDFSLIEESRENLGDQTEKLVNAIQKVDSQLQAQRAKVFPFLGMDLRHFNHCTNSQQVAHRIRELSLDHLDPAAYQHPGLSQVGGMENGTILGIKLYPPIGFSPFPDNPAHRRGSQCFFDLCGEKQIPITTHCQGLEAGSYRPADVDADELDTLTHPQNWQRVLKEQPDLRINFAHFGGEQLVRETFFKPSQPYACKPPRDTWVWDIVEMLKAYPNTYADISAFDFTKTTPAKALGVMLILDHNGLLDEYVKLPPNGDSCHRLRDKLMWGSDLPMTLKDNPRGYPQLFPKFTQILDLEGARENLKASTAYGDMELDIPEQKELIQGLVSTNPARFLFS